MLEGDVDGDAEPVCGQRLGASDDAAVVGAGGGIKIDIEFFRQRIEFYADGAQAIGNAVDFGRLEFVAVFFGQPDDVDKMRFNLVLAAVAIDLQEERFIARPPRIPILGWWLAQGARLIGLAKHIFDVWLIDEVARAFVRTTVVKRQFGFVCKDEVQAFDARDDSRIAGLQTLRNCLGTERVNSWTRLRLICGDDPAKNPAKKALISPLAW